MLLSTLNIIISIYAILSVAGVVVTFIGIIVAIGITILVGLSVDYVLHIANSYNESEEKTRYEKVSMAILEIGVSVFSAAITTLGSATLLLFTTVLFFVRFGLFVFLTITLSFFYAFGLFVALVLLAGPVGRQGSLLGCWRRCTTDDD